MAESSTIAFEPHSRTMKVAGSGVDPILNPVASQHGDAVQTADGDVGVSGSSGSDTEPSEGPPAQSTPSTFIPSGFLPSQLGSNLLAASRTTYGSLAISVLAVIAGVIFWHVMVENRVRFILNFDNIPSPLAVWAAFLVQINDPTFYTHIGASLQRIGIAYVLAIIIGVSLGVIAGRSVIARSIIMPYVEIFRPIPAVAWIPLAILMWPTEEGSIIYITFLGAVFPIILNTMQGVAQTPEVLVRAAQSLGAKRLQIFRHVVLPAALPNIATGLAIGMGVAWFSLLAGEIISGQYGIGYFTWNAYGLINYPDIVVGMLCIGLLGTTSTYAVRFLTKPFLRWQEKVR